MNFHISSDIAKESKRDHHSSLQRVTECTTMNAVQLTVQKP